MADISQIFLDETSASYSIKDSKARGLELTQEQYDQLSEEQKMNGTTYYIIDAEGGGGGGTTDYEDLDNKPSINGVELSGNKTSSQLGLLANSDVTTTIDTSSDVPTSNAVKTYIDEQGAKTVSGNPITITDAEPMNAESVVATITPTQSGSGTPSPTNVRPFIGLTEVKIDKCGKNLFNQNATVNSTFAVSFSEVISNYVNDGKYATGYVNGDATPKMTGNTLYETAVVPVKSGSNYVITAYNGNNFSRAIFTDEHGNILSKSNAWATSWSHTASENEKYLLVSTSVSLTSLIQVEVGSQATAYEPYQSNSVTVQLGDTYYGGTLDVTSGKLRAEYQHYSLKSSNVDSMTYQSSSVYRALRIGLSDLGLPQEIDNSVLPMFSSFDTASNGYGQPFGVASIYYNGGIGMLYFWDNNSTYTDESTFKQGLKDIISNNGIEFMYKLATPIEIQLTPQQIALLENNNTITTNASSLEVKYQTNTTIGDTLSVLDKRITQLDDGKANGAGLTFSVDQDGILCVTY